ncbi:GDSL-type esterase/lipase family protein [Priestia megaterium]|uniref:SGNH/GDSL hydrolase family protein n=1 Tax=Priestia TaxID=2800373 RepID=UPI003000AEAC
MSSIPKIPEYKYICFMGDSFTNSDNILFIPKTDAYPYQVQLLVGGKCRARNFGVHGETTSQMLARFSSMTKRGIPTVASIYGATNDARQTIADTITQANLESMIDQSKAAGVSRIILCNIHTTTSPDDNTKYASKRTLIKNIAANKNVVFCDFSTVSLVAADYQSDGYHLKASGLKKLADKFKSVLDAQGWTSVLKG